MSASRFGRVQKATALVPLALLSVAWTVNATGLNESPAQATGKPPATSLPDGTTLPDDAIDDPASVTDGLLGEDPENGEEIIQNASTSGIPAAALAAYQRAATVINTADDGCHIEWQLIAAIGKVESNHGRYGGNVLNAQGVSTPGIYGVPLDGDGVARITDTDGGQFDGDTRFDRAVGPMQFIPSTWSMVGVDADSDGTRNPQDVDDAALGAAVYLCSGTADLSTDAGRREAVYRYNHSQEYVETVLAVYEAYLEGDYTEVPNNTTSSDDDVIETDQTGPGNGTPGDSGGRNNDDDSPGPGDGGDTGSTDGSELPPVEAPEQEKPTEKTSRNNNNREDTETPTTTTTAASLRGGAEKVGGSVATVLATPAEITEACRQEIVSRFGSAPAEAVAKCVARVGEVTVDNLGSTVDGVVTGLADVIRGLLGLVGDVLGALTGQGTAAQQ